MKHSHVQKLLQSYAIRDGSGFRLEDVDPDDTGKGGVAKAGARGLLQDGVARLRDLQEKLRAEGWNVRVYIPFGTQWYPYLMRRLAERPENIAFIMGNVMKEALGGR